MKKFSKFLSVILSLLILISITTTTQLTLYAATMPSCSGQKASNITSNSARVDFTIKNPSKLQVKTCGMQIRKKGASSWTTKSETVNSSYQKKTSIPVWYTIGSGKEFNYKLAADTTYEYRGFCKYNNKTYYTGTSSFKTKSKVTMPSCSGQKASNITSNSARVDFTIKNPSNLQVKTCGMQIRKKGASSWTTKSETVNSSYQKKTSIPVWYTIGAGKEFNYKLAADTTYEYRGFCKYNNATYYTSTATFKTSKEKSFSTKINELKKKYPEGTSWTSKTYAYGGYGCYAFAATCYNYVNGHNYTKQINTKKFSDIKVGDMVHYYDTDGKDQHWVYVIAKDSSKITVGEGNYGKVNSRVHWGRTISKSYLEKNMYSKDSIRR